MKLNCGKNTEECGAADRRSSRRTLKAELMSNSGRNMEDQKEMEMVKDGITRFQTQTRILSAIRLKHIYVVVFSQGIWMQSVYVLKT